MELLSEQFRKSLSKTLLTKKQTVSVAESVTSGYLQLAFSSLPDAALFFQGGISAYNLGQKTKHLSVDPIHAMAVNCVSQQVADEMALGAAINFHAHWSIGVTGYASPVPESGQKLFAFFSMVSNGRIIKKGKLFPKKQNPAEVQQEYAIAIMKIFSKVVKEK